MRKRNEISIFQWTWNKRKRKPVKYFVKKICFQQKFRSKNRVFLLPENRKKIPAQFLSENLKIRMCDRNLLQRLRQNWSLWDIWPDLEKMWLSCGIILKTRKMWNGQTLHLAFCSMFSILTFFCIENCQWMCMWIGTYFYYNILLVQLV